LSADLLTSSAPFSAYHEFRAPLLARLPLYYSAEYSTSAYSYYHKRILRWVGHVARMPMTRAPRQLLTGWVAHSRPNGCPEMTWGRTLKKALKCKGLPVNFKEWRAIAEDRSEWRSRTYSKPTMPPSEH